MRKILIGLGQDGSSTGGDGETGRPRRSAAPGFGNRDP